MATSPRIRLGTRASALARWQAEWVASHLVELGVNVEVVHLNTQGDVKTGAIGALDSRGVFTTEIQRSLLEGAIDLAVHSLKDLPTDPVQGLTLAAVPPRESPADVLVSHRADSIEALPHGAWIGTGSLRRRSQLLHLRPDLLMKDIRGNVDTRLRKLDEDQFDAIVLAEAGLKRLGLVDRITHVLPKPVMMPAVGQGALGLEARAGDDRTIEKLASLDDLSTHRAVVAERSMLAALRGGCLAPVGAWARAANDGTLHLDGVVLSHDGARRLAASSVTTPEDAAHLGEEVAAKLIDLGADELIAASRQPS